MRHRNSSPVTLLTGGIEEVKGLSRTLNTEYFPLPLQTPGGLVKIRGDYRPVRQELRRLIRTWFECELNVGKLLKADPVVAKAALVFDAHLISGRSGQGHILCVPVPKDMPLGNPLSIAIGLFLGFLFNPYSHMLAGPCKECDQYYVRKTIRQIVYCSSKCGRKHTSRESNRVRAQTQRAKDIKLAQNALNSWCQDSHKEGWKDYVHRKTRVSKNLLTRTFKSGELVAPCNMP
jgi:hypothetical protein